MRPKLAYAVDRICLWLAGIGAPDAVLCALDRLSFWLQGQHADGPWERV